ncbi:MAG: acetate/propionate family kinase [Aquificaceae bacterium]
MRRLLTLNYGSSSLKFALFEEYKKLEYDVLSLNNEDDHKYALLHILERYQNEDLSFVVHRVVHGMGYKSPMLLDKEKLKLIKELTVVSPLHNTFATIGIETVFEKMPWVSQYAVFDTSFHATMPLHSSSYAIPRRFYEEGIKRYGFHGVSYSYLLKESSRLLKKDQHQLSMIMLHLGSGSSICAVHEGKSVDTSMGMTPLEGLIMSTRGGDLDPGIVLRLLKKGLSSEEVERILYRESGLKGICGLSDMRQVIERVQEGDDMAELALSLYVYRIKKYIGAYHAVLPKLHAIVFSGGIGENNPLIRSMVCKGLEKIGIIVDEEMNKQKDLPLIVNKPESKVKVLVIRTDEELEMVSQVLSLVEK